ncbi:MAG TPA: hypothetical protein PKH50_01405 [bacterium]|mgnify:FL=1|nr:hypothetical protein [bacterium]
MAPNRQNQEKPRLKEQKIKKQENPEKGNSEENNLEPGFNLISQFQNIHIVPEYASKLISLLRKFIIIVSVGFGVLLILNIVVSYVIGFQKNWQNELLPEIDSYAGVEEKARRISDKTVAYKKFFNERKLLSEKLSYTLDNIGNDVELKDMQLDQSGFELSLSGSSALSFTDLIIRYLDKDMLSEIVILSANFDKSKNDFNVRIRGVFK